MWGKSRLLRWLPAFVAVLVIVLAAVLLSRRQADTLVVGYMRITAHLPMVAALETGVFRQHGLDVRAQPYPDTPTLMEALKNNLIDVAYQVTLDVVMADTAVPRRQYWAFLVALSTPEAPIDGLMSLTPITADSLRGATIGHFPGATAEALTRLVLLGAFGLQDSDYRLVALPPPLQLQALEQRRVKALLTYEPIASVAVVRLGARRAVVGPIEQYVLGGEPWYGGVGVFTDELVRMRKAVAVRFQRALSEALDSLRSNPSLYVRVLMDLSPGIDSSTASGVPLTRTVVGTTVAARDSIQGGLSRQLDLYRRLHLVGSGTVFNVGVFDPSVR